MQIDYKAVGKRIRAARIRANLTQEALAEKANLSVTHMSNIERGNSKLSLPMIVTLANALDTTVDQFLCDSVRNSKEVFVQEIQDALADCDNYEIRFLSDLLLSAKESLRRNAAMRIDD